MATSKIRNLFDNTKVNANGFALNPDSITTPLAVANGWHSSIVNYPSEFKNMFGVVITVWAYGSIGNTGATRVQTLIAENGKVYIRVYENNAWGNWAWKVE